MIARESERGKKREKRECEREEREIIEEREKNG